MQVFQTSSSTRWVRFQWGTRIIIFIATLFIIILAITISRGYTPELPHLKNVQYKKALDSTQQFVYKNSVIARQYGGFRKFIQEKEAYQQGNFNIMKMKPTDMRSHDLNNIISNTDSSFHS